MGRSAEDDNDVLALPLQRPRRHVSTGLSSARSSSPSFDPEAARKAWRQVARVRGGGPSLGVDPSRRRPGVMMLLGTIFAAAVVWGLWSWSDPPKDVVAPPKVANATATADTPPAEAAPVVARADTPQQRAAALPSAMPPSSIGQFVPTASGPRLAPPATEDPTQRVPALAPRAANPVAATPNPATPTPATPARVPAPSTPAAQADATPRPTWDAAIPMAPPVGPPAPMDPIEADPRPSFRGAPLQHRGRPIPPGTAYNNASAFLKIPRGPRDRAPLEGIGVSGIHIDRLDFGSSYDRGICHGPKQRFSANREKSVQVCFRAVHQRQSERVMVKWSKNGRLVRRAWVVIPAAHAYRTRAGLRLRDASVGKWNVRVESSDGVLLAQGDFKVSR